jgi:glutathione S-transferase
MLSFGGAFNGLGTGGSEQTYREAVVRGWNSLDVSEARLREHEWLALGWPTIADVAVFVYMALSPMGGVGYEGYLAAKSSITVL